MVCALSMLMAAWVEHRRLVAFHAGAFHKSTEPDLHHIRVVDMSVFWQIPQVCWLLSPWSLHVQDSSCRSA